MTIMTAGVHFPIMAGFVGKGALLLNEQSIHIDPQSNFLVTVSGRKRGNNAGPTKTLMNV